MSQYKALGLFRSFGAIGLLHTLPAHRNRGAAKLVAAAVSVKAKSLNIASYSMVNAGNKVSIAMHERMGAKRSLDIAWVLYEP